MYELILAFLASLIANLLIIRFKHLHNHLSGDSDLTGPQKFHTKITPRIGGISIVIGLSSAILMKDRSAQDANIGFILLLCSIPVFSIGLIEDLIKRISIRMRLLFTAVSAACVIILLNIQITYLAVPFIDLLFLIPFFGFTLTVVAITGLANAYNIIDCFNGLSSMVGIITLLAIGYMGHVLGDPTITYLSLVMASAILGFFVWNYPMGLIFLGDGGAYLIGFWVGTLSILLCHRHPEVSPWFALLINGYPIMETMFTIYRRGIHQGKSPGQPDGIHFHTLIYKRLLQVKHAESMVTANSRTAPYLWFLAILSIIPAILWWQSTPILVLACLIFIFSYVWVYQRIVKFKTPSWMHL